jgi:hypothetical protein
MEMKIKNKITGEIFEVSRQYARLRRLQKRIKSWADVIDPYIKKLGKDYRLVMIGLTYAELYGWKAGDMRRFMLDYRKVIGSDLLAYAWVAELQRRGAVHYHLILLVKKGTNIPMPDTSGLWVHGSSRIETARTPYYLLTYSGKEYQKLGSYPKGLRAFAVWISESVVSKVQMWLFKLSGLPVWLTEQLIGDLDRIGQSIKRVEGGGWVCMGKKYLSPYEVIDYA